MRPFRCGLPGGGVLIGCAILILQSPGAVCDQLVLKDGRILEGNVVNATPTLFVIKLDSGETRPIPRRDVAEYLGDGEEQPVEQRKDGMTFRADAVVFLPRADYRRELLRNIGRAQESIFVIMYEMSLSPRGHDEPSKIADALIDARKRGVDVRVLFEDPGSGFILDCNSEAAEYLSENGVRVKFDDPKHVTHTKLVIIDGATSILGSHNWSSSGLTRNSESSVLVSSKDVAAVFGQYFAGMWAKGNGVTGVAERQRREAKKRE